MLKQLKFVVAAVVAAAFVVGPASALAETPPVDGAHCAFTGATVSLDAVPIMGGTGNYHFQGTGTCALHGDAAETGVVAIGIDSSGSYVNQVCGTGTADGSATITGPSAELPATINYHIQFVAGVGVLTVTGGSHADGSGAQGGGGIDITPTNIGGCVTAPALGFNVEGTANVVFNDA